MNFIQYLNWSLQVKQTENLWATGPKGLVSSPDLSQRQHLLCQQCLHREKNSGLRRLGEGCREWDRAWKCSWESKKLYGIISHFCSCEDEWEQTWKRGNTV